MLLRVITTKNPTTSLFRKFLPVFAAIVVLLLWLNSAQADCVVLLHGLARSASSMSSMADALVDAEFSVENIDYPSRVQPIEQIAGPAVE